MSKKWGRAGSNLPSRILNKAQMLDAASKKKQSALDVQIANEAAQLEKYTEQFDFHHSSLQVVHGDHGRTLIATKDVPAGTVLIQCTPAAQFVCNPEDSHRGNLALGMQLLATCTNHGHDKKRLTVTDSSLYVDSEMKDAKEYPLSDVFPVQPERLYPSLTEMVDQELPNPLLANGASHGQLSLPMPPNLTAKQQQDLLALIQSPHGIDLYKRCVHIARYNSVLAHGELPYLLPVEAHAPITDSHTTKTSKSGNKPNSSSMDTSASMAVSVRDNITQVHVIPCMEPIAPRMCVFPAMSLLNHSCAPNAAPAFFLLPRPDSLQALSEKLRNTPEGENPDVKLAGSHALCVVAVVRAMRPIKAGEEVHINYISLAGVEGSSNLPWLKEFREKSLRGSHGFSCVCERCRYEDLIGATNATGTGSVGAKKVNLEQETRMLKAHEVLLRELVLCAAVTANTNTGTGNEEDMLKREKWVCASECSGIEMLKALYDNPHWKALTKNAGKSQSPENLNIPEIHPCFPGNDLISRAKSLLNDTLPETKSTSPTCASTPPAVILRGSPTLSLLNTLRSAQVTYTGTLAGVNTEKAVLQAVKVYDKCLSVLLGMVEDDEQEEVDEDGVECEGEGENGDEEEGEARPTRPMSLISTSADGTHTRATGTGVSRALARANEAKEVAVVLEAARANLGEYVGDGHWAMMLLNVALGAAYHHAGLHALALAARTTALASVGAMLWCEAAAVDIPGQNVDATVFGTPYSILAKHCKTHWGVHSAVAAAFGSVVESAQLVLAQVYAEAHRQSEDRKTASAAVDGEGDAWGEELLSQVKAVVAASLHMC